MNKVWRHLFYYLFCHKLLKTHQFGYVLFVEILYIRCSKNVKMRFNFLSVGNTKAIYNQNKVVKIRVVKIR